MFLMAVKSFVNGREKENENEQNKDGGFCFSSFVSLC